MQGSNLLASLKCCALACVGSLWVQQLSPTVQRHASGDW